MSFKTQDFHFIDLCDMCVTNPASCGQQSMKEGKTDGWTVEWMDIQV